MLAIYFSTAFRILGRMPPNLVQKLGHDIFCLTTQRNEQSHGDPHREVKKRGSFKAAKQ